MAFPFTYKATPFLLLLRHSNRPILRIHFNSRIHLLTSNPDGKFSSHAKFWALWSFQWAHAISPSHLQADWLSTASRSSSKGHHHQQTPWRGRVRSKNPQKTPPYIQQSYRFRAMPIFWLHSMCSPSLSEIDCPFSPTQKTNQCYRSVISNISLLLSWFFLPSWVRTLDCQTIFLLYILRCMLRPL